MDNSISKTSLYAESKGADHQNNSGTDRTIQEGNFKNGLNDAMNYGDINPDLDKIYPIQDYFYGDNPELQIVSEDEIDGTERYNSKNIEKITDFIVF